MRLVAAVEVFGVAMLVMSMVAAALVDSAAPIFLGGMAYLAANFLARMVEREICCKC